MCDWSMQLLVNSEIFKLSLNLSLTHLRGQISCYESEGELRPVMFKFENFQSYKNLYGKPFKGDWVAKVVFLIQILLIFGVRCMQSLLLKYTAINLEII